MTFEAFGVGFHNKGAELMLEAIRHQTMIWGAPLAAAPRVGSVRARRVSRLLCLTRAARPNSLSGADIWAGLVATFPRPVRHAFGVERYSAVRVVLDASGYTYGDAWTVAHCEEGLDAARRVKANGGFFVLLP